MQLHSLAVLGCFIPLLTACGDGLSHRQVRQSWNQYIESSNCRNNVEFTGIKVLGITQEGNQAAAQLEVRGRWKGPRPSQFELPMFDMFGPCSGFTPTDTGERTVEHRLLFTKYDSGWRLNDVE